MIRSLLLLLVFSALVGCDHSLNLDLSPQTPVVSILSPAPNVIVKDSITVKVSATCGINMMDVCITVNGTDVQSLSKEPYEFKVDTKSHEDGPLRLGAFAINAAGDVGDCPDITVIVSNK